MRLGSVRYGELRRSGLVVVWFGVVGLGGQLILAR